ncbi:hypothetical protein [Halomicrococcus sp. NG-SE-24]|uniref:hypothetical protein n=1 Tax=Halomicrococcus sp. NG-SE-24 TaxID=3436928 RepID=UPI003D9947E4
MEFQSWLANSYERIRTGGLEGAKESARPVKHKLLSVGNRFRPDGTSIYEREWDLLIVLDACRFDLFLEFTSEYNWMHTVGEIRSLDSATPYWMRKTFVDEHNPEIADTAYICGNPFSKSELNPANFGELIELWRTAWIEPGTVPPEAVTDETIRLIREKSHDRVIAHYMQPHCPFISRPELSQGKQIDKFGNQEWRDVWGLLRDDEIDLETLWEGYKENLRLGLDEVDSLLSNVDADRVIVTSNHGNGIGEWGVYGHPPNLPLKNLRRVPWLKHKRKTSVIESLTIGDRQRLKLTEKISFLRLAMLKSYL